MRILLGALALVFPVAVLAQEGKPMRAKELAEFLGPVSPKAISWKKLSGPDFDVYYGHAKLPLSGDVSFYLGGAPDFTPSSGSTIVKGKLGIFPVAWHRIVAKNGSVTQSALIPLDDYWKVNISVQAKRQQDVDGLLAVIAQLPTFTKKPKPTGAQ
jgi:hypothetical protein